MKKFTFKLIVIVMLAVNIPSPLFAEASTHILTSEQWNIPRQAAAIIEMPALRAAMQEFQSSKDNKILVKYPGGDVGTLWAHELRSWLISLGLSEKFIELVPGSSDPNQLEIIVLKSSY